MSPKPRHRHPAPLPRLLVLPQSRTARATGFVSLLPLPSFNDAAPPRFSPLTGQRFNAFTLIEIMIVVAIMGIALTMGVPIVYRVFHRPPLDQAVTDVLEVCSNARSRAILKGHEVDLIFHPKDGQMEVGAAAPSNPSPAADPSAALAPVSAAPPGSGLSAKLSDQLQIEMLDVNLTEWKDADLARVRFYPNGTCDEMTLILYDPEIGQRREISLEITTGLASVESNPSKFR